MTFIRLVVFLLPMGSLSCASAGAFSVESNGVEPAAPAGRCVAEVWDYGSDGEGEGELKRTVYRYDRSRRVVRGPQPVTYNGKGQIVRIGSSTWTRDGSGVLRIGLGDEEFTHRKQTPDGGFHETTGYAEQAFVERTVLLDGARRVSEATWSGTSHSMRGHFAYDRAGRVSKVTYIDLSEDEVLATFVFDYGPARAVRVTERWQGGLGDPSTSDVEIRFDEAGRMTRWTEGSREEPSQQRWRKFAYDERGNLVSLTLYGSEDAPEVVFRAEYSAHLRDTWCGRQGTIAWPTEGPHWWHASMIKAALMAESPYEWREHPLGWERMN